jgi:hypothetical protein
LDVFDLEGHTL